METDKIVILDFGSQYTQLIARRVRELNVYSEIHPYNYSAEKIKKINPKGIILSGGPSSVYDKKAPMPDKKIFSMGIPVLGLCYGLQVIAKTFGGKVESSDQREYGFAELMVKKKELILKGLKSDEIVWSFSGSHSR